MTREGIISGLLSEVRQPEEAAITAQRALDHFRPLCRAALSSGDDIRIAEPYALVVGRNAPRKRRMPQRTCSARRSISSSTWKTG